MNESILSNLIEKKNVLIYIKMRKKQLQHLRKQIVNLPVMQRETASIKITGQLKELSIFYCLANENKFKMKSKELWLVYGKDERSKKS